MALINMLSHQRYYVYSSYAATLNLVQTLKKPFIWHQNTAVSVPIGFGEKPRFRF